MKFFIFFAVAVSLVLSLESQAIPLGAYKAVDAFCTNPNYVYSKDEQAYIDSVRGLGSCKDGSVMSPPCFEDYYVFANPHAGQVITVSKDLPGVECTIITEITYIERAPGHIEITFGKERSIPKSSRDGTTISCGAGQDSSQKRDYFYRMDGQFLLFVYKGPGNCGEFILKQAPVRDYPRGLR